MKKQEAGAIRVLAEIEEEIAHHRGVGTRTLRRWSDLLQGKTLFRTDEPTLFPSPPEKARARSLDPSTSHEAAKSVNLTEGRRLVLQALNNFRYNVVSDEQGLAFVNAYRDVISPSGYRTRRKECVEAGWAEATGETVENSSGRSVSAWRITEAARRVLGVKR